MAVILPLSEHGTRYGRYSIPLSSRTKPPCWMMVVLVWQSYIW
jgi:hypothetical protein